MKKTPLIALITLGTLIAGGCKGTGKREVPQGNTSTSGTVIMACDASFENVMQQEIEVFEYITPMRKHALTLCCLARPESR